MSDAATLQREVRRLEARLQRLEGHGARLDMEPLVRGIVDRVATLTGVTALAILSQRRASTLVRARHLSCWLARELTPYSFPRIGRALGNRDHSTVQSAIRRHLQRMEEDPAFAAECHELADMLAEQMGVSRRG